MFVFRYKTSAQADAALSQNGQMLNGTNMLGVKFNTELNMSQFEYSSEELIKRNLANVISSTDMLPGIGGMSAEQELLIGKASELLEAAADGRHYPEESATPARIRRRNLAHHRTPSYSRQKYDTQRCVCMCPVC